MLRPGRFDRPLYGAPPDLVAREQILVVHTRNKPIDETVDLLSIARATAGLTGAVNGEWQVEDADAGKGIDGLTDHGSLWQHRRGLALDFWSDGPTATLDAQFTSADAD